MLCLCCVIWKAASFWANMSIGDSWLFLSGAHLSLPADFFLLIRTFILQGTEEKGITWVKPVEEGVCNMTSVFGFPSGREGVNILDWSHVIVHSKSRQKIDNLIMAMTKHEEWKLFCGKISYFQGDFQERAMQQRDDHQMFQETSFSVFRRAHWSKELSVSICQCVKT